ncbi:hypothetical protein HDIA_0699 [Hartmannibacter diazotrophicus]|uniref:Uncharacterized protein n=1 Tax=Hartmannibacter diazotrophicus TaxID=1482074 RepID=A0A2C9D1X0_9HYPH|nr:hypothetical protein [Hartmannibacter diazotrophicus]SON54240.1 hypothetical protein HDIA_0699 [Hartmannibacter diazotrophicus]
MITEIPKAPKNEDFSVRLRKSIARNLRAPQGRGQQKWLREQLDAKFGIKVTAEGVRKWFAGEAFPRQEVVPKIAEVLEADEMWLLTGRTPGNPSASTGHRGAIASDGAVTLVAAHIQLAGGTIANASQGSSHNLEAIINLKHRPLTVLLASDALGFELAVNENAKDIVLVVPTTVPTIYEFYLLEIDELRDISRVIDDSLVFSLARNSVGMLCAGQTPLRIIRSFAKLDEAEAPMMSGFGSAKRSVDL